MGTLFDGQTHTESKDVKEALNKTKKEITAVVDHYMGTIARVPNLMNGSQEGNAHTDENAMRPIDDEESLERGKNPPGIQQKRTME